MEPACGSCRRSKIRCTHRKPITDPREASTGRQPEAQRPIQPKRDVQASQGSSGEQASSPGMEARLRPKKQGPTTARKEPKTRSTSGSGRPRGRPPKRKVEETKALMEGADEGNATVEPESPPKRARRGCKPGQRSGMSAEGKLEQAKGPEPPVATISAEQMAENLTIASRVALGNVLAEEVEAKVRECEAKWEAVSNALEAAILCFREAKQLVDPYVAMWRRGDACG
ncbi:uncharacterized protein BDW43DRAFT_292025 [Aspergillus alliaceus]|uniref:uncharacterized protein n=1 Tax=Petromyces alliaceus TaxID=209559 RepID=UPI0012A6D946|nr:uncharacterized protein BDW43DRAFT_292025 [Aspergillus alliaceus]KAB8228173.1 hypothetical protein BDW43DRAFT_292025 [Aspergillus alliaceus]